VLKRAEARAPIPTGLHPSAQGCRVGEATLGNVFHYSPQPQRGCINPLCAGGCNPFRVVEFSKWFPRVARSEPDVPTSQPWAECCDPVGVNKCRAVSSGESRTLAALRDALLQELLSGELRVLAATAPATTSSA
jgi:hypothetical protein